MKKSIQFLTLSAFIALNSNAQITSPAPYCAAGYDDGFMAVDHHISKVTFGSLNNNSGATQYPGTHYVYYNNLSVPNLTKGNTYTLSITHDGGASIHFLAAYIDFNNDGDFNDAGERVLQKTINDPVAIPNPATVAVTIPASANTGNTRMRVMVFEDDEYTWSSNNANATPCTADATGFLDWGETEDYNINISGTVTNIQAFSNDIAVSIYPNPVTETLYIESKNQEEITKINVFDLNGRFIKTATQNSNQSTKIIDFSDISEGLYIVEVYTPQGVSRLKITK